MTVTVFGVRRVAGEWGSVEPIDALSVIISNRNFVLVLLPSDFEYPGPEAAIFYAGFEAGIPGVQLYPRDAP